METSVVNSLEIKQALPSDTEPILSLVQEFYNSSLSEFSGINPDAIRKIANHFFLPNNIALVARINGETIGVILGVVTTSIFNPERLVAQEFLWYVKAEHRTARIGKKLFDAFEIAAKARGAKAIVAALMINSYPEKIERFYNFMGYKKMEVHYIKEGI